MKKLIGFVMIGLLLSSCSLFQKPSMSQEEIDAMVAENQSLKEQVKKCKDLEDELAMAKMAADDAMLKLANCEEAAKAKVHVIVGSFKNSQFAEEYSAEMKQAGYDGTIIPGPYSFNLVTSSSHETVKAAINALYDIRVEVIETAWIYIE